MPKSTVCLSFDFDALSVWFGHDRVTPAMLHRGEFGARVGVPRILRFLRERELPATFFVPGHTVESFPEESAAILEGGHEIAHHSYAHVDPSYQSRDDERADMERAWKALEGLGVQPLGFRSPSADFSDSTLELIEEFGFLYDSSLTSDDYRPFHPRIGDRVSASGPARAWPRSALLGAPLRLGARRLAVLPVQLRSVLEGRSAAERGARELAGRVRLDARAGGRRTAHGLHAPAGDRPRDRMAMLGRFVEHCREAGARFERMGDFARSLG